MSETASSERAELLAAARLAAAHAWAPYSHFRVGAAVALDTTEGRRVVTGAERRKRLVWADALCGTGGAGGGLPAWRGG